MKSFTMLIKRPFRSGEEKNLSPHLDDHLFVNGRPSNYEDDNDLIISPCILNDRLDMVKRKTFYQIYMTTSTSW